MTRRRSRGDRVNPLAALEALERAAGGGSLNDAARRAVMDRYARRRSSGRVVMCTPTFSERTDGKGHSAGKPIYDNARLARAAADELERLGARPLEVYPCPRSRHGHVHLRTKRGKVYR